MQLVLILLCYDMLLWFALYDHTKYTPWGTVDAADTDQLEISYPGI